MKSLLHSRKELCNVSAEECLNREEQDNFIEVWHNLTIYIYFMAMKILFTLKQCGKLQDSKWEQCCKLLSMKFVARIVFLELSYYSLENGCDISRLYFSALYDLWNQKKQKCVDT